MCVGGRSGLVGCPSRDDTTQRTSIVSSLARAARCCRGVSRWRGVLDCRVRPAFLGAGRGRVNSHW